MFTIKRIVTLSSLVFFLALGACGSRETAVSEDAEGNVYLPNPAPPPPEVPELESTVEQPSLMGKLVDVNEDAQTFTLQTPDGAEQQFHFRESTTVIGGYGVHGLATRAGNEATVYYDSKADPPTAITIELGRF